MIELIDDRVERRLWVIRDGHHEEFSLGYKLQNKAVIEHVHSINNPRHAFNASVTSRVVIEKGEG